MKTNICKSTIAALLIASLSATASPAGNVAEQTVSYEVQPINEISVSSPSVALVVNSATAGEAPNVASDFSTTYAITTNETNRKITGSIDSNMPNGVTLSIQLAAPSGASSLGSRPLSTSPVDLVTGVSTLNDPSKQIRYDLQAVSGAGVVQSASKTVTLTITAEEV